MGYIIFFPAYVWGRFCLLMIQGGLERQSEEIVSSQAVIRSETYEISFWWIVVGLLVAVLAGMMLNYLINRWKNKNKPRGLTEASRDVEVLENTLYKSVWASTQVGLLLTNEAAEILAINPFLYEMTGTAPNHDYKEKLESFFNRPPFSDVFRDIVIPKIKEPDGTAFSLELALPIDSEIKDIELLINKISIDLKGKKVFLVIFRDISDKKAYEKGLKKAKEQAEEASRLKTSFLSNMSHEIRTPLNGILGSTANMILQNSHNRKLVDQLEIVLQSGERLLSTINNILDMSRIVANKMEIVLEETNINDYLSKILVPFKALALKKELLLTVKYETKPFVEKIDKRYFEIIVNNVVGNAIKYSEKGLIIVSLKKENDFLCLTVQDNGIGISEDYLEKLFNPFEQESFGYNREFEGSGIGLSITKNLVDLLSGEITINSKKGEGTLVRVVLPLKEAIFDKKVN